MTLEQYEEQVMAIRFAAQFPLVQELPTAPDVIAALKAVAALPDVVLLESTARGGRLGRYSFLTADPFERFELQQAIYGSDPFSQLRTCWRTFGAATHPDLPPFQGGAAGILSYELGAAWERLTSPAGDEFGLPVMAVGLYDWVLAWDHQYDRAWIISHGFPASTSHGRRRRASERIDQVQSLLPPPTENRFASLSIQNPLGSEREPHEPSSAAGTTNSHVGEAVTEADLVPQWPAPGKHGLTSNFSRDRYLKAVARVIDYIFAGDIFQANLSQRLLYRSDRPPWELYSRLRACNPAPFAGFYARDDWAVVSASPERYISLDGNEVETRPIKGTRRRPARPEADLFTRDELRESEKDQAENVMIVDLLRNDLSRVCRPGSLTVPQLCCVETFETVQHLVSEIRGTLAAGRDVWDLLAAVFPGGSITGAPKVRAMQIIGELEPTVRGPYCGSMFYAGFDGRMDSNLLIRSFVCRHGWVQCSVGGGIVAQSDPINEFEETLHKAAGMLQAL